jgi:hypothetical protein
MIRVHYEPTFRDYWRLQLYALFRGYGCSVLAIYLAGVIAAPFIFGDVANGSNNWDFYISYLPPLVFPGFLFLMLYWASRRAWNRADEVRSPRDYEFDENGMKSSTRLSSGSLDWRIIKKAFFHKGIYYLKTGQRTYFYFPCSAVSDQKAFVELLRREVETVKVK